jgi:hypothetical protein
LRNLSDNCHIHWRNRWFSKSAREWHLKRKIGEETDGKGFGHMGMFDAQIVVASVEKVVAVDESELREPASVPH